MYFEKEEEKKREDIEKMGLYFILAFIYKTFMVWPGANNQLDYTKVLFGWIKHSYCFNYPVMSIL